MTPVRLEPAASRSRVKDSTTEPLRSLFESRIYLDQLYSGREGGGGGGGGGVVANDWCIILFRVLKFRIQI